MEQRSIFRIILLGVLLLGFIHAKNIVKGYVYDSETGIAVPGVQIFLIDSSKGTITDNSGYFHLAGLDRRTEITIQHVKYFSQNREVTFDKSSEIYTSYYLYSKNLEIDSVVVWGDTYFPGRYEKKFNKIQTKLYSTRYRQYLQMLKRKNWSWQELVTYGLWTILEPKYFNSYWNLKGRSQREQFLTLFWQKMDPTPETDRNEFREEFERRIRYNWTYFSANDSSGIAQEPDAFQTLIDTVIGAKSFKHESEDRLRPWTKRAPWDARGSIYLKYGSPTSRGLSNIDFPGDVNEARQNWGGNTETDVETWYYSNLGVDFDIYCYKTNIFRKAIIPGERATTSIKAHYSEVEYDIGYDEFYNNFVNNKIFFYDIEKHNSIDDFKFKYSEGCISFSFIPEYFMSVRDKSKYSLVSTVYKIVDKNQPALSMKKSCPFVRNCKNPDSDSLTVALPVNLGSGEYFVELKVEDHNSGKVIDNKYDFVVK